MEPSARSLAQFNIEAHVPKGLSGWRLLYVNILREIQPSSVLEVGSGSPEFLQSLEDCPRRVAIDGGDRWGDAFRASGIEFRQIDLDNDDLPAMEPFRVTVCSDVFEHLLYPDRTLKFLRSVTADTGFLIAHVPNEFRLQKTSKIMLGRREAKYSHPHCEEFNHPHFHRFTKIGFRKFLELEFRYNLFVSDLRYDRTVRILSMLGLGVPYALEGGPTFLSTNSEETFTRLKEVKRNISAKFPVLAGDQFRRRSA